MPATLPTPDVLTVYGAAWCSDCRMARQFLDTAGVEYRYVDLEADRSAQDLLDGLGYRSIPVVITPEGRILIEPSRTELAEAAGFAA